ncbi:RDD family protein [Myxococcota bacterium]|nr:RDD family protein [Myxococcota bacterium]
MGIDGDDRPPRNDNPFAAPDAPLGTEPAPQIIHHGDASRGQRFVNFVVDYFGTGLVSVLFGALYAVIWRPTESGFVMNYVVGALAGLFYYFPLEALTGRTLGKLLTGTRVVDEHGQRPTMGAVFIRSLCRYVPFEPFSFLNDDRGWHDEWSHTRVVRLRPGPKNPYDLD